MKKISGNGGFSIIEVLIAAFIVAFGLLAMASLFQAVYRTSYQSDRRALAGQAALSFFASTCNIYNASQLQSAFPKDTKFQFNKYYFKIREDTANPDAIDAIDINRRKITVDIFATDPDELGIDPQTANYLANYLGCYVYEGYYP